jgi:cytochrome c5
MKKLFGMMLIAGLALSAVASEDDVKSRTAPAGSLCMSGDSCAAAPAPAVASGPKSGADVYKTACTTCHTTGLMGAPKTGTADWEPRVAKGMDTLYLHAVKGFNAMPPKGMCATCTDEELHAAVDYMIKGE